MTIAPVTIPVRSRPVRAAPPVVTTALVVALLAGCASTGGTAHPQDPFESYNRSMTQFNDAVDSAILTPAAKAYEAITPQPVRTGIGNVFANVGDLWSFVNHLLQGNGEKAYNHIVRFTTNTIFGLGGLLDIATEAQIPRERQDFGQTLASWGMPTGPYLVLPLLGPSTLRDTAALPVDWQGYGLNHINPEPHLYALTGLRLVDNRASLLGATDTLGAIALDRYSLTRDFYLRQRMSPQQGKAQGHLPDDLDHNDGQIESYDDE